MDKKSQVLSSRRITQLTLYCILLGPWAGADELGGDWPVHGGDPGGQHYSPRTQIDRRNVSNLRVAWTFHTGALRIPGTTNGRSSFETNPVLWDGRLYLDTPYDAVFALDASTGVTVWSYDPQVSHYTPFGIVTSRGVALWHGPKQEPSGCARDRVFVATLDRRLIARSARDGTPCADFGNAGTVDLAADLHLPDARWYSFTSPPTVVGNVVAIGSSVGDNQLVEAPSGVIRGFDARSGQLLWSYEPLPWAQTAKQRSGSGGAWSVMAADQGLGVLYVPTGSASVDFYGVNRPGDNRDANSVVALDAETGRRIWGFQVVHHDLWDMDVAAEPLLFMFRGTTPAVAVTTKMGMTFVLDRRTGSPLYPVEERAVPPSDIPGEIASPTQPFSTLPLMAPMTIDRGNVRGRDAEDTQACRDRIASLVDKGPYTPVGLKPTLLYPGNLGGVNWGSGALDPRTNVLYANVNSLAFETRLVPRDEALSDTYSLRNLLQGALNYWKDFAAPQKRLKAADVSQFMAPDMYGAEFSAQAGTPYRIYRAPLVSPRGMPCTPGPWGALVAIDLDAGRILWRSPLAGVTVGGPIVTAGGLVFTGGGAEPILHAFDAATGQEMWRGALPAAAQSTPMTYLVKGRQYLVIAAGGHGTFAPKLDDSLVAFALAQ